MLKTKNKIDIRTMVKAGFLVAISIVMTRFVYIMLPLAGIQALRISFGDVPLMLSGILFGPLVGGLTGLAADLIGFLINPMGPYYPGFTLSSILWGVLPGLIFIVLRGKKSFEKSLSFRNIVIAVAITAILVSLILNTYWLSILYGKGFLILLPPRFVATLISIPIHSMVIRALVKYLKFLI
ncbi:MAG: folate family ECF transporter S component [Gudongella sp.]|jgi:ECF transporter S component (folate family)|nr:folate family ECF transporter S component [Gudongella sp.]